MLKFVNSSYFGFSRKITSVRAGISLVGVRTIENFALWNAVFSLVPNPRCGPFDLKGLWQDSLRRALFARNMAKLHALKTTEEIFAAALLQDMAVPLLAKEFPQIYTRLLHDRGDGRQRLSHLENETLGWTHAEAAGMLVRQWNLPSEFAVLIEGHASGGNAKNANDTDMQIVALSALLPSAADPTWSECAEWDQRLATICPPTASAMGLLGQVDREFADFAPVLQMAAPRKSLTQTYQEALATV